MEKISLTVRVPALGGRYEFLVPAQMAVRDAQLLMVRILHSEYGISENAAGTILFDTCDGKALRQECSLEQQEITSGHELMLL